MNSNSPNKGWHLALWIVQGLLAAAFAAVGLMKMTVSMEQFVQSGGGPLVEAFGMGLVRFIGCSEFLGALGLLLPSALRIKPVLTVWAAVGIAIIMVLASIHHAMAGESVAATLGLLVLALLVVWGRSTKAVIASKS
ncbi:MAG: DoxX family protein [Bacteroidota bacterium]